MKDNYFLDTNILVYLLDPTTKKQSISQHLVSDSLKNQSGFISIQVIQEFLNLATGKFAIRTSSDNTKEFMQRVLLPLCRVYTNGDLLTLAIDIHSEYKYSFYDSLIISAAIRGGSTILYSEDLQSGQKIRGMEIVNPYKAEAQLP